jgi:hypothetical protein
MAKRTEEYRMNMILSVLLAFTHASVGYLTMGAVVFVTAGRRVLNPKSGVCFVTEDRTRRTTYAQKVVVKR